MAKSLVERYEEILAQDPTSHLFVELANSLVEQGDNARALAVCQQGVLHNQSSVAGRVVWGKALINLGRPAEAMEQFDRAVAVNRDDPYAYHLICEVLLSKGLYRSALPLLRKASVLAPDDDELKSWLEQTQGALAGGPPPVVRPSTRSLAETMERTDPGRPLPVLTAALPTAAATPPPVLTPVPPRDGPPPEIPAVAAVPPRASPSGLSPVLASRTNLGSPSPTNTRDIIPVPLFRDGAATESGTAVESEGGGGVLADIPELSEASTVPALPRAGLSTQATEAIAKEFEQRLRAKVEEAHRRKSFLQAHWAKLGLALVVLAALAAGTWAYRHTRAVNQGRDLRDALASARKSFSLDTAAGYRQGLDSLRQAVSMDASSEEAWALTALGHARLFAEHGGAAEDRSAAEAALAHPGVAERVPGAALVARWLLADAPGRAGQKASVVGSSLDLTDVHELAGRILLAAGDAKTAVLRFKRALELQGANVRALVALADYYREAGDDQNALGFYATAGQASPTHPGRVLGEAESQLALGQETPATVQAVEKLPAPGDALTPPEKARRSLVLGRLLSATGAHALAVQTLQEGSKAFPDRSFDFQLALGYALRGSGDMPAAQAAFEAAAAARPKSDEAREGLARVLLARDREREVLQRFAADEGRKMALVRGEAAVRLKDWKRARAELARTQVAGRVPVEAVALLALADAAEGEADKAVSLLERTQASSKRPRTEVSVALGKINWQRGVIDQARAQFEQAMKDPRDWEGACALGRLLLSKGAPEKALEPLSVSVQRNGSHGESRHAFSRALLSLGRGEEGLRQAEAWLQDNPSSAAASRDVAFAEAQLGRLKEAEGHLAKALQREASDVDAQRLRAQLLFAKGDVRGGMQALEKANHLNPKDSETFCAIGRGFLRQLNAAQATRAYQAAVREDPDSVCGRVGLWAVKPAGAPPKARALLQSLAAQAPRVWDRSAASATLARALLAAGAAKEARHAAEQAATTAPLLADGHASLGAVLRRQKEDARARDELARAVQLDPGDASFRLALADALATGSDADLARALSEYQTFLRLAPRAPEAARVKKVLPTLKKKTTGGK
ncbi:MAG TPA: tetratricopeptide repeat protein [Myxococcaceae bacterium]|nr:tetratricopeptide repeat protein [Myxococcaceae bacterium]